MGKWIKAIMLLIVSVILTRWIPFNSFFRNVDTMVHEFGHAVVTLIVSGTVKNIELNPDHSGLTRSLVATRWETVLVALAGYISASLFAWLLFRLYSRGKQTAGLMLIVAIAAVSLILFVRNSYGVGWLIGFIALSAVILLFGGRTVGKYYFLLIAFLSLEESVTGSLTILIAAYLNPAQAGDASVLQSATGVPAIVWSAIFTLFSLWCAVRAFQSFGERRRSNRKRPEADEAGWPQNHPNH